MTTERQRLDVDIACAGFGPAMGGFLTTLNSKLLKEDGSPTLESRVMPGIPLQIICYERADDTSVGVSGVVTQGKFIQNTLSKEELLQIPMAAEVKKEQVLYLLDPHGASRRCVCLKIGDFFLKNFGKILPWYKDYSFELPWIPPFLKKDGYVFSIGQFNQWVASKVMESGMVQIWPSTPVEKAILKDGAVVGVQLSDQGVDLNGNPTESYISRS